MSCHDCEEAQTWALRVHPSKAVYVRIGNGNVRVIGCEPHVSELLRMLAERRLQQHPVFGRTPTTPSTPHEGVEGSEE